MRVDVGLQEGLGPGFQGFRLGRELLSRLINISPNYMDTKYSVRGRHS